MYKKFIKAFPKAPKYFVPTALAVEAIGIYLTLKSTFQDHKIYKRELAMHLKEMQERLAAQKLLALEIA